MLLADPVTSNSATLRPSSFEMSLCLQRKGINRGDEHTSIDSVSEYLPGHRLQQTTPGCSPMPDILEQCTSLISIGSAMAHLVWMWINAGHAVGWVVLILYALIYIDMYDYLWYSSRCVIICDIDCTLSFSRFPSSSLTSHCNRTKQQIIFFRVATMFWPPDYVSCGEKPGKAFQRDLKIYF